MGLDLRISGAKGGGGGHTPVESPNTLRSISSFRILDLISEGEIAGLVNGMQSVFLDGTPLANADGTLNFTGVAVQTRPGTQDQDYIQGYGGVESDTSVATELRSSTPWVHALTDTDLSAVRITLQVDALQRSNTTNGDINGFTVQYAIDVSTDGAAYQTVLNTAFSGKATSPYQRSHRIDLPPATTGWNVRVRRLTPNQNSATTSDTTRIVSITEIIDAKLRCPNSALIAISGDASQFTNIPSRAYEIFGRKVKIPSNYNPQTRVYTGVWDGSFQNEWTNNPAWIFYDIVTQDRFGLGDLIDASMVDKWELYRIAVYCDQLVDDGKGGQEPRFTCNTYLQSRADAFKLLGDLTSVFRGMSYWMGGVIAAVADMPQDPVYPYTAANVIDGKFTYQSSPRKTRFTTALVTWNDPSNAYGQEVEYVEDIPGLARYGLQQTEFVAFGCTSQGQAHRAGRWALVTSQLETDSVTFAVGMDGVIAAPGQIIQVADPARAGARQGGRIAAGTAASVTVDRLPDQVAVGHTLTITLPTGVAESRTINSINGRVLGVGQPFTAPPVPESVWTVESETLATQHFRVLSVSEDSSGDEIRYTISAVQHVPGKFANIDNGALIQIPPISQLPTGVQPPPANVRLFGHVVVEQGIANNVMTIEWDAAPNAADYKVEWQKDEGQWIQAGTVSTTSVDVAGIYTGTYIARVTAFNVGRTPSIAALSAATPITGKTGEPPRLTTLTTTSLPFGIGLDWTFPPNATDTQRTEIWASTNAVRPDVAGTIAYHLGDYAYPGDHTELHGLSAGASLFFWGRIIDKAGNVGGWYPEAGAVNGQSISDPDQLQDYWKNTIGRGALQASLLAAIDAGAEFGEYANAPVWDAGAAYAAGVIVSAGGRLWRAAVDVPAGGAAPGTNPAVWEDIGDVVQTAYGQAASIHDTTLKVQDLGNTVQATASRTDAVYAQLNPKSAGELTGASDGSAGNWNTMPSAGYYSYVIAQVQNDRALGERIDTISATVGGYQAKIQTIAQAQATLDGKVSASYVMKVQVAANGQRYMAGIALGVDYSGGDVSSQVLVNAGTFAVINAIDGSVPVTYPFVIQGNQVFISQALIGTGWITNAMIGNQIASTATVNGLPVWEWNKSGTRYTRGQTFTITEDSTGWRLTNNANGVVVVELGDLG